MSLVGLMPLQFRAGNKNVLIDTLAQQILRRISDQVQEDTLTRWVLIFAPLRQRDPEVPPCGATSVQLSRGLRLHMRHDNAPMEAPWKQPISDGSSIMVLVKCLMVRAL